MPPRPMKRPQHQIIRNIAGKGGKFTLHRQPVGVGRFDLQNIAIV